MNLELKSLFAKLFLVQNEEIQDYNAPLIKELAELPPDPKFVITPNNPPWSSFVAFMVWLASVALIVIFPNIFVLFYVVNQGMATSESPELLEFIQNNPNAIFLALIAIIPAHLFTVLIAWLVATNFRKYSFREVFGWKWGGFTWWHCLLILVGFFALAGLVGQFFPEQENDLTRILQSSRNAVIVVAILATFSAPLVEEVIYRGILYSAFQRTFGVFLAILFVTAVFAGVHFLQYWGSPGTIILICLLSLILTLVRVRTDNLLPCIVLHMLFNGIQSVFLILQPYISENIDSLPENTSAIFYFMK